VPRRTPWFARDRGREQQGSCDIGIGPPIPLGSPCRSRLGQPPNSAQSTLRHRQVHRLQAPCIVQPEPKKKGHRDRRTASTPAMAAAAAKNIAKKAASYAHANPRLKKETNAIMVSSRTLASNSCPPLFREHTLALSRMSISRRQI
jgi:hypothetical protein